MSRGRPQLVEVPAYPSEFELAEGKTWNPLEHEQTVRAAMESLESFVRDIASGNVPKASLSELVEPVETLGLFAGYPMHTLHMQLYLEAPNAGGSYTSVAAALRDYLKEMHHFIGKRVEFIRGRDAVSQVNSAAGSTTDNGPDVPF